MTLADQPLASRATALAILAALVLAFLVGPVAAYVAYLDGQAEQLRHDRQLLQRYRLLATAKPAPAAAAGQHALLFPEVPESQAVALLQEALKGAANAARVEVQGFQVLRSEAAGGALRIGVRLRARGDIAGLEKLLYTIESARPALYPDNLDIRTAVAAPDQEAPTLEFQFDVAGFMAGPT